MLFWFSAGLLGFIIFFFTERDHFKSLSFTLTCLVLYILLGYITLGLSILFNIIKLTCK